MNLKSIFFYYRCDRREYCGAYCAIYFIINY